MEDGKKRNEECNEISWKQDQRHTKAKKGQICRTLDYALRRAHVLLMIFISWKSRIAWMNSLNSMSNTKAAHQEGSQKDSKLANTI